MQKNRTKMIVMLALLIAMDIVLTRMLSVTTPVIRVGFGFVPVAICAMMFGPIWAGLAAAIADIIGVTLFPPPAPPFLGFTLSAILVGVVFGLFLYKSKGNWLPILCAAAINAFIIGLILNTFWVSVLTGNPFSVLFYTRLVQSFITLAIQFVTLNIISKILGKRIREIAGHNGNANHHG